MDFPVVVYGLDWTIRTEAPRFGWPPRLSIATTWGSLTLFKPGLVPDTVSLGHEFFHRVHTNDWHYALSCTIGRLWHDAYWRDQEVGANSYGELHAHDPVFQAIVDQIRAKYPGLPDGDITHPVGP